MSDGFELKLIELITLQMSANKCKNCGSTEIETDPSRGDAVCTQCGVVLEDQIIVNENEFAEGPHGNITLVGQFVSSESSGGVSTRFGAGKNNLI